MAADCEIGSSFSSSGVPDNVETTPPPVTNPAPVSSVHAPALVAQETPHPETGPRPLTRTPSKAPPLPVLRFPKVSRGRGYNLESQSRFLRHVLILPLHHG